MQGMDEVEELHAVPDAYVPVIKLKVCGPMLPIVTANPQLPHHQPKATPQDASYWFTSASSCKLSHLEEAAQINIGSCKQNVAEWIRRIIAFSIASLISKLWL